MEQDWDKWIPLPKMKNGMQKPELWGTILTASSNGVRLLSPVAGQMRKKGERNEKVAALGSQKVQASSNSVWLGSWGLIWWLIEGRRWRMRIEMSRASNVVSVMKHFHACLGTKRRERAQPNSKEKKKIRKSNAWVGHVTGACRLSEARPDFRLCEWNRASPPKLMDKEKEEWE